MSAKLTLDGTQVSATAGMLFAKDSQALLENVCVSRGQRHISEVERELDGLVVLTAIYQATEALPRSFSLSGQSGELLLAVRLGPPSKSSSFLHFSLLALDPKLFGPSPKLGNRS